MRNSITNSMPQGITQRLTTTGSSQDFGAVISDNIFLVRVRCESAARIGFSSSASGSENVSTMGDGGIEYFAVRPGMTLSAVQVSTAGEVEVAEMTH